jgi:hypothetical protein
VFFQEVVGWPGVLPVLRRPDERRLPNEYENAGGNTFTDNARGCSRHHCACSDACCYGSNLPQTSGGSITECGVSGDNRIFCPKNKPLRVNKISRCCGFSNPCGE